MLVEILCLNYMILFLFFLSILVQEQYFFFIAFSHIFSRMKSMVEVARRVTMQEIQARRKSSIPDTRLNKRLGMSLPNLGDNQTLSFQRNNLLTRVVLSDSGETAEEYTQFHLCYLYNICILYTLSWWRGGRKRFTIILFSFSSFLVLSSSSSLSLFSSPSSKDPSEACEDV